MKKHWLRTVSYAFCEDAGIPLRILNVFFEREVHQGGTVRESASTLRTGL